MTEEIHGIAKAGGPYIGPHGGLWADPKHTVHWEAAPKSSHDAGEHAAKVARYRAMHEKAVQDGNEVTAHMAKLQLERLNAMSVTPPAPAIEPAPEVETPGPQPVGGEHSVPFDSVHHEWKPRFGLRSVEPTYKRIDKEKANALFLVHGDIQHLAWTAADVTQADTNGHARDKVAKYRAAKEAGYSPKRVQVGGNTAMLMEKDGHVLTNHGAEALAPSTQAKTEPTPVVEAPSPVAPEKPAKAPKPPKASKTAQWVAPKYGSKMESLGANKHSTKAIAAAMRQDVKDAIAAGALPKGVKLSIRTDHNSITMEVQDAPFQMLNPEHVREVKANPYGMHGMYDMFTPAGRQLMATLKAIHGAYNYDKSDRMTDYFNVNYYGDPTVNWEYERDERDAILAGKLKPEGDVLPAADVAPEGEPSPEVVTQPAQPAPPTPVIEPTPPVALPTLAEHRQNVLDGKSGSPGERDAATALKNAESNTPNTAHLARRAFDKVTATNHMVFQLTAGVKPSEYDDEMRRIAAEEEAERQPARPPAAVPVIEPKGDEALSIAERIAQRRRTQDAMKDTNAIIRGPGSDESKVMRIKELGFSEKRARDLVTPPAYRSFMGPGFPAFELKNNAAEIKRLESRAVTVAKETGTATRSHAFAGGTVHDNAEADRVQIEYHSKPDAATIATLKSHGFKWAPSLGVWQRQRTDNARNAASAITGVPVPGALSKAIGALMKRFQNRAT